LSLSYFLISDKNTLLEKGERNLKVTRYYASQESALNARSIIEDLLVSELARVIDKPTKDMQLGSECA
jgi:hypothetical protein